MDLVTRDRRATASHIAELLKLPAHGALSAGCNQCAATGEGKLSARGPDASELLCLVAIAGAEPHASPNQRAFGLEIAFRRRKRR
jgi:hypothetical protein